MAVRMSDRPATVTASVHPVPDTRSSSREVAYLRFDGETEVEIDAWRPLHRWDTTTYQSAVVEWDAVYARFRHWADKAPGHRDYHHGWPSNSDFWMGYVFRWQHDGQRRRLYGFLIQPRPDREICVLCCYKAKNAFKTKEAIKRVVREMHRHQAVRQAVKDVFGRGDREAKWKH